MFVKNFKKEKEWYRFIDTVKSSKGSDLVADEDIWPFILASLKDNFNVPLVVITSTIDRAEILLRETRAICKDPGILSVKGGIGSSFTEESIAGNNDIVERIKFTKSILTGSYGKNSMFVMNASSLLVMTPEEKIYDIKPLKIYKGMDINREKFISKLISMGYDRANKVYDNGEFSVKGSVMDIFDTASKNPIRIDFMGDDIEKIIQFDPYGQKILENLDEYYIFTNKNPWKTKRNTSVDNGAYRDTERKLSVLDMIKHYTVDPVLIICDPLETYLKLKSDIEVLEESGNFIGNHLFLEKSDFKKINIHSISSGSEREKYFIFNEVNSQKKSLGNSSVFIKNITDDLRNLKKIVLSISSSNRIKIVKELLLNNNITYKNLNEKQDIEFSALKNGIIYYKKDTLLKGYRSKSVSIYGELDIYNSLEAGDRSSAIKTVSKADIKIGENIVHKTHGIARYGGIVTRIIDKNKKEYYLLEYADNDKLFVPIWQTDKIHKYIGDKKPVISPLDSRAWQRLKSKARKSVHKLAIDLAKLYAEREELDGHAYPVDESWQSEMEDMFPFKETRDQVKAIDFVKRLMEKPRPMDVLVCGDVGFGKTEIAVRAAFKAVSSGKQVLMLVPTTILADQHYLTFSKRYEKFPVVIDVVSRFRTKKEQENIIEGFKDGKIDMLIGTHRLLSNDIKPVDLGLIIIDEEQRFGVNAKEKIKLLKKNADVMSLSATPIPRTLHMALTGIRDIVLLESNPEGRLPIETFVGKIDYDLVKLAIEREIKRDGQVYYVSSRIMGIEEKEGLIKSLVPSCRIAVAHGRMNSKKIEKIMTGFLKKEYDLLITTSIIESGMDISNVNTLIVEDSHKFGLSQLYQLRGRVGRSTEKAYAYLFYPGRSNLSFNAFQRLKTLAEYTELGSGYNIAMKDMEIRGVGEMLGAKQHGHINSIGFEMYNQIIREEIEKLKGMEVKEELNILIDIPISAYIPNSYIKNESERVSIYKQISSIDSLPDINRILIEIGERHGDIPEVTKNLINIARLKYVLRKYGIEKLLYIKSKGIVFKKIKLSQENAMKINLQNKKVRYNPKLEEIVLEMGPEDINLDLVLSNLSDIIGFI